MLRKKLPKEDKNGLQPIPSAPPLSKQTLPASSTLFVSPRASAPPPGQETNMLMASMPSVPPAGQSTDTLFIPAPSAPPAGQATRQLLENDLNDLIFSDEHKNSGYRVVHIDDPDCEMALGDNTIIISPLDKLPLSVKVGRNCILAKQTEVSFNNDSQAFSQGIIILRRHVSSKKKAVKDLEMLKKDSELSRDIFILWLTPNYNGLMLSYIDSEEKYQHILLTHRIFIQFYLVSKNQEGTRIYNRFKGNPNLLSVIFDDIHMLTKGSCLIQPTINNRLPMLRIKINPGKKSSHKLRQTLSLHLKPFELSYHYQSELFHLISPKQHPFMHTNLNGSQVTQLLASLKPRYYILWHNGDPATFITSIHMKDHSIVHLSCEFHHTFCRIKSTANPNQFVDYMDVDHILLNFHQRNIIDLAKAITPRHLQESFQRRTSSGPTF